MYFNYMPPLISVILPVYNASNFLAETISSILEQTFKDFELIIINDGSTDTSEFIIKSFQDPGIIYVKQENRGVGFSIRKGCEMAKGKYIARIDADDICMPNRFEIQIDYLRKNPDTVLVSSAVIYIDYAGNEIGRSFPYSSNWAILKKMKYSSTICHPAVMMQKKAYDLTGGYKNVQPFEDLFLWLSLSKYGKLHNLKMPLIKYRILENSVSHEIPQHKKKILFEFLLKNYQDNRFIDSTELTYSKLYKEIKLQLLGQESKSVIKNDNEKLLTSRVEKMVYTALKKIHTPEYLIENIICSIKKSIAYLT